MRSRLRFAALAVPFALIVASCSTTRTVTVAGSPPGGTPTPSTTTSLVYVHPGGQALHTPPPTIAPEDHPYPFATPTPPDEETVLDGTYMKIVPIEGRVEEALPIKCFRCIQYRPDVGVSTLVLYHGMFFVHHQLSGQKMNGNFTVEGDRLTLFNDANCPTVPGTYRWERRGQELTLEAIDDPCPFDDLRQADLAQMPWLRVDPCVFRIQNLWPAAIAC